MTSSKKPRKQDLTIRLTPEDKAAIKRYAVQQGIKAGALGRSILADWVRQNQNPPTAS